MRSRLTRLRRLEFDGVQAIADPTTAILACENVFITLFGSLQVEDGLQGNYPGDQLRRIAQVVH
jgi:hypothetical protein